MAHVWAWFQELSAARGGGYGIVPISYSEIDAYSRLMRRKISPFEAMLIRQIDDIAIAAAEKTKPGEKMRTEVDANDGAGVASMFRAMAGKRKKR